MELDNERIPTSVMVGEQLGALRFLWLEITKRCNLACRHCYADSSPKAELLGSMTEQDWIRLIHEARAAGCEDVQFIGGEPLVHPSFPLLLRTAHATGMGVEVFTNATLIEDDTVDLFHALGTHVAVSVYAEDAEVHDRVTARTGSHAKTKRGICRLVDRGVDLRVGIIEQGVNADQIARTEGFVRSLGVANVGIDHIRAVGRGERDGSTGWKADPMASLCGQCHKGRLAVDINGDAFPCVLGRAFPVGNVREGLANVLDGMALGRFRHDQKQHLGLPKVSDDCVPDNCRPSCYPSQCRPDCGPNGCSP